MYGKGTNSQNVEIEFLVNKRLLLWYISAVTECPSVQVRLAIFWAMKLSGGSQSLVVQLLDSVCVPVQKLCNRH
jgi:hypothetical protein